MRKLPAWMIVRDALPSFIVTYAHILLRNGNHLMLRSGGRLRRRHG
jgi:ABC-type xylose transport system permease subunit